MRSQAEYGDLTKIGECGELNHLRIAGEETLLVLLVSSQEHPICVRPGRATRTEGTGAGSPTSPQAQVPRGSVSQE